MTMFMTWRMLMVVREMEVNLLMLMMVMMMRVMMKSLDGK